MTIKTVLCEPRIETTVFIDLAVLEQIDAELTLPDIHAQVAEIEVEVSE